MQMGSDSHQLLELFVLKAEKLAGMKFTLQIIEQRGIVQWRTGDNEPWQMSIGDEEKESLIATLRMFMQQKDQISFRSAANLLQDPDISSAWKEEFKHARTVVNLALDGYLPHVVANGHTLRRKEIWDVMVNGDLAHMEPRKRATYEQWRSDPALYAQIEFEFHTLIVCILDQIGRVALASRQELDRSAT